MRGKLALSYAPVNGLKQGVWKDATGAAFLKFLGRGAVRKEVADAEFLKFKRGFICGIRSAELAARKPASIGRLQASGLETRVNTGLAGSTFGNARFTRGLGQVGWLARMKFVVCHLPTGDGFTPDSFQAPCLPSFAPRFCVSEKAAASGWHHAVRGGGDYASNCRAALTPAR